MPFLRWSGCIVSNQSISTPNQSDLDGLEAQRKVVNTYLDEEGLRNFDTPAGKLGTLRALLTDRAFPNQIYKF